MYKNVVIVLSGEDFVEKKIISFCKEADFIIAGNGGLNILDRLNIKPDLIIGDMDSAKKNIVSKYKNVVLIKHPVEKDLTDSQLAIQKALDLEPENISLLASSGSYLDHTYSNAVNLIKYFNFKTQIEMITSNSKIFVINKSKIFGKLKGRRISFFPLTPVKNIKLSGFKYSFKETKDLTQTDYSISNVIADSNASIEFDEGKLLCMLFDAGYK